MSERTAKIENILASRKPIAEKTRKTIEQLQSVHSALQKCSHYLTKASSQPLPAELLQTIKDRRAELDTLLNVILSERIRDLEQIERRFSRPTLNIGVVGSAGQGKSTLLQQLTGLTNEEIPTGSGGDCTGAAAIIENSQTDVPFAEIDFFTEAEFLSHVVVPYYQKLDLPLPSTLEDLERTLPNDVLTGQNHDVVQFIKALQTGLRHYRQYLGKSSERISKDKIRTYTAKRDIDNNLLSIWAAVKSVRVFCRFPGLENEKISVGDTPGLGDRHVPEAETRLMKDFGRNIDAVMMLRKIKERGIRTEDVRLFNLVQTAIAELPPEKWSYFLVNVFETDKLSPTTLDALKFLPDDFRDSPLKNMAYNELDCSNREEVLAAFDNILNSIAANQQELDQTLYSKRFEGIRKLLDDVKALANKLSGLFPKVSGDQDGRSKAGKMFKKEIWNQLAYKLKKCVSDYQKIRDDNHPQFDEKLRTLEDELQVVPGLRTAEEYEKRGASKAMDILSDEAKAIRRNIIISFDRLNEGFNEQFNILRDKAQACFTDGDGGRLKEIMFSPENGNAQTWWVLLADEVSVLGDELYNESARQIGDALFRFGEAGLSFRGFLLPHILKELDALDTDNQHSRTVFFNKAVTVEDAVESLDAAAKEGINKAIQLIRNNYSKCLSMALFAAIEDLRDAVVWTGDESSEVWADFYAEHRNEIWPDVFKQKEADVKFRKDWDDAVAKLKQTTEIIS